MIRLHNVHKSHNPPNLFLLLYAPPKHPHLPASLAHCLASSVLWPAMKGLPSQARNFRSAMICCGRSSTGVTLVGWSGTVFLSFCCVVR